MNASFHKLASTIASVRALTLACFMMVQRVLLCNLPARTSFAMCCSIGLRSAPAGPLASKTSTTARCSSRMSTAARCQAPQAKLSSRWYYSRVCVWQLQRLTHHLPVTQVGVIGENLVLRRCACLHVPQGLVLPYVHNSMAAGMGSIGVLLGTSPSLCFLPEIWWLNPRAIVIVLQVCRTCTN